jgi:glutamine synthetase
VSTDKPTGTAEKREECVVATVAQGCQLEAVETEHAFAAMNTTYGLDDRGIGVRVPVRKG